MKKVLFGFLIAIALVFTIAAVTHFESLTTSTTITAGTSVSAGTSVAAGTTVRSGISSSAPEYNLGYGTMDSLGRLMMYVRNKLGDTLKAGRTVKLDTVQVKLHSTKILAAVANATPATTAATEGYPIGGVWVRAFGTPVADTFRIYGKTLSGINSTTTATTEALYMNVANDTTYSNYVWAKIDSVKIDTLAAGPGMDSAGIYGTSVGGVVAGLATNVNIIGVTTAAIVDNAVGQIVVYGPVLVKAKTGSQTYIRPGHPIIPAAAGTVLPMALTGTWTDSVSRTKNGVILGYGLGGKDDVSDTASIWMFFSPR